MKQLFFGAKSIMLLGLCLQAMSDKTQTVEQFFIVIVIVTICVTLTNLLEMMLS